MTLVLASCRQYSSIEIGFRRRKPVSKPTSARQEHQQMVITLSEARASDGLRPIDMSRDVPQIVELLKMVFGEALELDEGQLLGDDVGAQISNLFYRFNPATSRLTNGFVWLADGRIVGNVTLLSTMSWDRFLVANVAVHPNYRRRGIARAMMHAVTSAVKKRGGRAILLQVVKDNESAIDLYRSLGYVGVGHMTTWYSSASRLRRIDPPAGAPAIDVRPLPGRQWREAYALDTACVPADLNWPEPLRPDAYRQTIWQRLGDVMNSRLFETWAAAEVNDRLAGLATISSQWGRSHLLTLRVHPDAAGRLERPLLAKLVRRLQYLPRRNVRIDHPDDDIVANALLTEANFTVQRTLTHMRLDLSR
jgi:ribosomal protein S18 acetylase RimI-like enzyme